MQYANQPVLAKSASDLDLTRRAADGDRWAQHRLLERLFERVRRTMSYLAGGKADAEDLAQVALMQILANAGRFRGESTLEHWADRIAVRTATKQFARNKRRRGLWERYRFPAQNDPVSVDADAEQRRAKQRLAQLMARLSTKNRTALTLHYVLGYPIGEIASICGCPHDTIRGRLRQGRKHLKKLVTKDPLLREIISERNWER